MNGQMCAALSSHQVPKPCGTSACTVHSRFIVTSFASGPPTRVATTKFGFTSSRKPVVGRSRPKDQCNHGGTRLACIRQEKAQPTGPLVTIHGDHSPPSTCKFPCPERENHPLRTLHTAHVHGLLWRLSYHAKNNWLAGFLWLSVAMKTRTSASASLVERSTRPLRSEHVRANVSKQCLKFIACVWPVGHLLRPSPRSPLFLHFPRVALASCVFLINTHVTRGPSPSACLPKMLVFLKKRRWNVGIDDFADVTCSALLRRLELRETNWKLRIRGLRTWRETNSEIAKQGAMERRAGNLVMM